MARRDALVRLAQTLLARRADLHKKLADELGTLRDQRAAASAGDSADLAFEAGSDEMASRLAELDDRQLSQLERVLAHLRQGTYGICEGCQKRIPLTRLNVLPHTSLCIRCEREMEERPAWQDGHRAGNWRQISDTQAPMQDQRINLSELEMSLAGGRRG